MKICRNLVIVFCVVALSVFAFAGCKKKEGPAEKAGKKVDQAVETAKEATKDAGKKVDQAVEAAKEAATEAKK